MTLPDSVFVHPAALCESDQIGPRTRVWAFAHVMPGAVVGADCNVCDHAFIESGAVVGNGVTVKNNVLVWDRVCIEDDVFLGPNAVFTNDLRPRASIKKGHDGLAPTVVRRGATIGANATIVCGTTIGEGAFVAAGAVAAADVAPYSLVAGNPARHKAWVCWCGEVLADDLACGCGRSYALAADAGLAPIGPDSDNSTG
ncbi:MAG: UDP-2-acetamido-3-amino-2,3-dideoxy-glucuronate N-acetyltransferase [Acidimicrobiaceae bacterium]|nr:UDP-2-acetamido-3-amino-2,3-dideoxy-glucuronate N-acetyltransferase [Acidimicrobiaceae bacterium]